METVEIIPCVCLTCGVRFSNPLGHCPDGHKDWLDHGDVTKQNQFFQRAIRQTGWTAEELTAKFMDVTVKSFKFVKTKSNN
jgi:hypothetical protein